MDEKSVFRLMGGIVGATITLFLVSLFHSFLAPLPFVAGGVYGVAGLLGMSVGMRILPQWIKQYRVQLSSLSAEELLAVIAGILLGLLFGALSTIPLGFLPAPVRYALPAVITFVFVYLSTTTMLSRPHDVQRWILSWRPTVAYSAEAMAAAENVENSQDMVLLDTSVIIDGRITDISKTGFVRTKLVVPNFVLNELQHIADSPDPIRRKRGRRGLEVLNHLQTECPIPFEIIDMDVSEVREVDSKLVALARHLSCPIMTNDYNLNRVAGLQGVTVLNINDLANAIKAAHLPGEELDVRVIQDGREQGQGVGYLDDGTMVVVEDGRYHMNEFMTVVVTKVLQTSAGRMIFAKIP